MSTATVIDGQSLFDIAIVKCGSPESAYNIAMLNGIALTDALPVGTVLILPAVVKKDMSAYFTDKGINPATSLTEADIANTIQGEGIEFWAIEEDFKVS